MRTEHHTQADRHADSAQQPPQGVRNSVEDVVAKRAPLHKLGFYHLQLDNLNTQEALEYCEACFEQDEPRTLYFVNAHCFNVSKSDAEYMRALNNSDLLLNDGVGIKIAANLIDLELQENMNGTDFIPRVLQLAAEQDRGVFFLGAKPGVAATAAQRLQEKYSGLKVSGTASGYFSEEEEDEVIEQINASGAEVVVVGMGVPFQEKWISRNRQKFTRARVLIAGGAIIDFSAGRVRRAPVWVQQAGFEWLYRLAQEPRRLFNRYVVGNGVFLTHVITQRVSARQQSSSGAR